MRPYKLTCFYGRMALIDASGAKRCRSTAVPVSCCPTAVQFRTQGPSPGHDAHLGDPGRVDRLELARVIFQESRIRRAQTGEYRETDVMK